MAIHMIECSNCHTRESAQWRARFAALVTFDWCDQCWEANGCEHEPHHMTQDFCIKCGMELHDDC